MTKTYQVPVMVTVQTDQPVTRGPDSYELAELLHDRMMNDPEYDFGTIISIDGIPAYKDDPNSPPVPARLAPGFQMVETASGPPDDEPTDVYRKAPR